MDEYDRGLSTPEKAERISDAWRTTRKLQLVGLRLAERWLGTELFERVQARARP
jgi:hypothetical protein